MALTLILKNTEKIQPAEETLAIDLLLNKNTIKSIFELVLCCRKDEQPTGGTAVDIVNLSKATG